MKHMIYSFGFTKPKITLHDGMLYCNKPFKHIPIPSIRNVIYESGSIDGYMSVLGESEKLAYIRIPKGIRSMRICAKINREIKKILT